MFPQSRVEFENLYSIEVVKMSISYVEAPIFQIYVRNTCGDLEKFILVFFMIYDNITVLYCTEEKMSLQ